jgi:hypothetical protein
MSKALAGAALLAGAAVIDAFAILATGGIAAAWQPIFWSLVMSGISMEAGAIADALTGQRGMSLTTRMAAGLRQIVYGIQRIGGTIIYQSTTGVGGSGGNYVFNYVIVLAAHEIDAIQNLYLDGRQVFWKQTVNPHGYRANMGCGSVATPPTTAVTITTGVITGITATGGSGFGNVKPVDGYRVRIQGDGTGAYAYATNSGTIGSPVWTVHIISGGNGYTTATAEIQGAYTFGGTGAADQQDPTQPGYGLGYGIGPGGPHYNFDGKVYCEVRFGDQPSTDSMASLSANDPAWGAPAGKNLSVGGCAYIYLNIGYDTANFPNAPEIRLTINGKNNIFDPRSGQRVFSTNWALQVADVLTDPVWGLGDVVNQAQLIAAANVCDELVTTSQGDEARYAQHIHYDTSSAPGDMLADMMPSAAGRVSYIGGEWFIWPAYWQGPSFSFDESALIDVPNWTPNRSFKDLVNRVAGTYVAPNYPYNIAGNLYDRNGWYYGTTANLWPLAWQPTNFPQYAQDALHGYAGDQWLTEDGSQPLPLELALRGVISIVQAQRIAKIMLLRNRQQGSGSFPMQLAAWQMEPMDVMQFSFAAMGWTSKYLEVGQMQFVCEPQNNDGGEEVLALSVAVPVNETDPSIYEWDISEELTPYDVPALPQHIPQTPAPPTSMTVTSSAATAIVGADGTVTPRALVSWTAPDDVTVTLIQLQYRLNGSGTWLDAGVADVGSFQAFIAGVIAGQAYDFRIRSLRANGVGSTWVEIDNTTISITLSVTATSGTPVAPPGTLVGVALSGGTADIIVEPFTATVGPSSVSCLPSGPYTLTGLNQDQNYEVYYIDATFAGGAITPIATQNPSDYLNKLGYFLIGSIVTPKYGISGVYRPSISQDTGTRTTTNPSNAFDANPSSFANVTAQNTSLAGQTNADCTFSGFAPDTTASTATLTVNAELVCGVAANVSTIVTTVSGVPHTLFSASSTTAQANYTLSIPSGTALASISIECIAGSPTSTGTVTVSLKIYDINIQ